jgi:hypothetical protein
MAEMEHSGAPIHDDRAKALQDGLLQLPPEGLLRLRGHMEHGRPLVIDEVHYDAKTMTWCALAVGLGVPERFASLGDVSEAVAVDHILGVAHETDPNFSMNPIARRRGEFYRHNRYADLYNLVVSLTVDAAVELPAQD